MSLIVDKIQEFTNTLQFTPDDYQIDAFNTIDNLEDGENCLIIWPTGCGKTLVAEYVNYIANLEHSSVIYTTPLKALSTEKLDEWSINGRKIVRDTSDDREKRDEKYYDDFDTLITTNERLDVILRSPKLRSKVFINVSYLIIDETHLLGSKGRGSTLEYLIMVMRELLPHVKIIGLSATLPNYKQFADWLNAKYSYLPPEKRPIPLQHYYYDPIPDYLNSKEVENYKFSYMKGIFNLHPTEKFLVFCSSRIRAESLAKRSVGINPRSRVTLKQLIDRGVCYHHAGLNEKERAMIESAFKDNKIMKLFATTTLAQGINLPAKNVIMFDLSRWSIFLSMHKVIEHYEIGQMSGRAGRRGYDSIGRCYYLGKLNEIEHARTSIENPRDMESQIDDWIDDKILALNVSQLCDYQQQIIDVFNKSFLIYRDKTGKLIDLIPKNIEFLVKNKFIWKESDGFLSPTSYGKLASRVYVKPRTAVEVYNNMMRLSPDIDEIGLIKAFLKNGELLMQVRVSDLDQGYIDAAKYKFSKNWRETAWVSVYNPDRKQYESINLIKNYYKLLGLIFSESLGVTVYGSKKELATMKKNASEMMFKLYLVLKQRKDFSEKFSSLDGKIKIAIEMIKNGILDPDKLKLVLIPGISTVRLEKLTNRGIKNLDRFLETSNGALAKILRLKEPTVEKMKRFVFDELM